MTVGLTFENLDCIKLLMVAGVAREKREILKSLLAATCTVYNDEEVKVQSIQMSLEWTCGVGILFYFS